MKNCLLFIIGAILIGLGLTSYFNDLFIVAGLFSFVVGFARILNRVEI